MDILVIGYGNPSRMDDGVGRYVVNRLNARWGLPPADLLALEPGDLRDHATVGPNRVRTLWVQQLDLDLAADVAAVDRLFLVDAHLDEAPTLEVEVQPGVAPGVTTHLVSPETLLALAQTLYGRAPRTTRLSVRGRRFDFGTELSPAAKALAEDLVAKVAAEVGHA